MKLIIGLGNPGEKFKDTRHNVGFMVVERLRKVIGSLDGVATDTAYPRNDGWRENKNYMDSRLRGNDGDGGGNDGDGGGNDGEEDVVLVKPATFMNESGKAVAKVKNFYKIDLDNVYVVHDDLDLKLGEYKIQKGVGPKVHNGILSVEKELGDKEFWRVRVGVDNRKGNRVVSGEDYVLGRFGKEERLIIEEVVEKVVKELLSVLE